ncbi:MAG: hypothetical protein WA733_18470 [Methylocystis sp.]|jgi:hypothetical protein
MIEQTGIEAKTIHRLLEADPKNGGFKLARGATPEFLICRAPARPGFTKRAPERRAT